MERVTGSKAFLVFSGGNDRAVVAFLRALSLCGGCAYIVARTRADRILRTAYRRDVVLVRDTPELTLDIFVDCVKQVRKLSADRKLVILPSSEYFNHFLLEHREHIESLDLEIPLTEAELYNQLTNKRTASALFGSAGIDVPAEVPTLDAARLPLVAKPIRNIGTSGATLYPALLHSEEDVLRFAATNTAGDFFFQEFVRGHSLYLFVYVSRDPEHILLWSQRNILQQPQGKSMLFAEPYQLHEMPVAKRLLDVLIARRFTGLGMIELIQDRDRFVFIEMNPRIWGPIQFCLDQHQPLLQAFIGQCLHGDPGRYAKVRSDRRRSHYFWLGGLLETAMSNGAADWHADRISWLRLVAIGVRSDVYLRLDSWRCFVFEIFQSVLGKFYGNRNQR